MTMFKIVNGKKVEISDVEVERFDERAAEDPVIAWRQSAWIEKTKFLIWAKRMTLITADEYLGACRGEWPASFTDALSKLPVNIDPIEAQGVFAAASEFWRMDPVLNAVAVGKVSDAELDVGFGWVG